ncbi:MAG: polysaccharide biosynthesis protein [Streptosporangiales bacterium]|nr:polysaccharide biosynthesis protein [Streptosporangiales bacterium]
MAIESDRSLSCPEIPAGELFGLEGASPCEAGAREIIEGSRVLVTGAGGSIGSEIARQARALGAAQVVCVDRDEYALYRLQLDGAGQAPFTDDSVVLADVASRAQLAAVFRRHRPDVVFHAAACGHAPLLERHPAVAVTTNVAGAMNVASLSAQFGVRGLVNVSSGEAAAPASVLGLTERLAEIVTVQLATGTRPASVRFGDVFAARGSLVETLAYQVSRGLPVTITDRAMARHFTTAPRAAGLVIEAAVLADGLSTFLLETGQPSLIIDLVNRYAAACGYPVPTIRFTGTRPGEDPVERLAADGETPRPTAHPEVAAVDAVTVPLDGIVTLCRAAAASACPGVIREMLGDLALELAVAGTAAHGNDFESREEEIA